LGPLERPFIYAKTLPFPRLDAQLHKTIKRPERETNYTPQTEALWLVLYPAFRDVQAEATGHVPGDLASQDTVDKTLGF
jgi:hypothetical protein